MRAVRGSIVVLVVVLAVAPAAAHIQLASPAARYVQNDSGLKTSPCGSGTATGAVTKLLPGQTLTVTWKESVPHAGHYRIALSSRQADFTAPTSLTVPQPAPAWVLADGIADKTGTQTYAQTVVIPNQECPACVLQLVQVMSSGTDGTNTGSFGGVYYACADLAIAAAHADGGASPDVAGPDATPRPVDAVEVAARDAAGEGTMDLVADGPRGGAGGDTTATGSGGHGGKGGTTGTGASGSNGGSTGHATSTGAMSAGGGSAATAAATGGDSASGGTSAASSGGTGGTLAGTGGAATGGAAATAPAPSGAGCSCRLGGPGLVASAGPIVGALGLGLAVALRRRRPRFPL